jgi:tetratricopeptide (TPR) repeat protein
MSARVCLLLLILAGTILCCASAQQAELQAAERLDAQQKCEQAEQIYQRMLARGAPSAALLNNLGSHYLVCGPPDKAQAAFERLHKLNPAHFNANLQLAKFALQRKDAAAALAHLSGLGDRDPEVLLARAEALSLSGKRDAASRILDALLKTAGNDPRMLYAIGVTCGRAGLFAQAETAFSAVLTQLPDDFDVLYNVGLAAARAGHPDRARLSFEVALKVKPGDVDALYELGRVESRLGQHTRAVYLLAQARQSAPQRADVLLALARAAQAGEFFGDALAAYDDYLKLQPADDMVRRDRAMVLGRTRTSVKEALAELTAYVSRHPGDAEGHYDLALVLSQDQQDQALEEASRAVALAPTLEPARFVRAWLLEQTGRAEEAIAELRSALKLNPRDAHALDLLGVACLALERRAEAEQALRQAVELAPEESNFLFHFARALIELGRKAEAQPYLDRFNRLRQAPARVPHEAPGLIEAATLSPAEASRRVLERFREALVTAPNDAALRANFGAALLAAGRTDEAAAAYRELLALTPSAAIAHEAGTTLLAFEQYALARDFLQRAAAERPSARIDLAQALLFTDGPREALLAIEGLSAGQEAGDALLVKARILDAAGQPAESDEALAEGLRHSISRPRLVEDSALLLLRHRQAARALEAVDSALKAAPADASLRLVRIVTLHALGRDADAERELRDIERRWPEWDRAYLIDGLILQRLARPAEARRKIDIALSLGIRDAAAQCALRTASAGAAPDPQCACQPGVYEPFFAPCPAR